MCDVAQAVGALKAFYQTYLQYDVHKEPCPDTLGLTEGSPDMGLRYCRANRQRNDPLNLIRVMPAKGQV